MTELFTQTVEAKAYALLKDLMQDSELAGFHLVGGTSLALQIGHRKSVDLDLFNYGDDFDADFLSSHLIRRYAFAQKIVQARTILGEIDGIKVDFIQAYNQLTEPVIETPEGIRLVSFRDIAAMKLLAIGKSGTRRKDFIDVAFLSREMSLNEMLERYREAYHVTSNIQPVRGLLYFEDIANEESVDLLDNKLDWKLIEQRLYKMVERPGVVFDTWPVKTRKPVSR